MARSEIPLEDMYANLVIDDEEDGGIIVASNEVVEQKQTYVLVGKFFTEKNINFNAMQNVMASLWRPREGMKVHDLGVEDPLTVKLQEIEIWVQVYDIPRGFLSENIVRSVGLSVGRYIEADSATFDGVWKSYVRIRVAMNVEKPLKRRMKIKRERDNWSWLNFKTL
ncbi:hypothetical protein POM88_013702 [Heracleum sosnowskyi]|uniref:DUF4283 domain-containing protein n=1 Tax=Heracleum sosnowskyi TaxID=360622 RepID=A0AAD8J1K9_9APIA|nr:hypothetical protein POM88_013702 [Heracleum sosnowskyi]